MPRALDSCLTRLYSFSSRLTWVRIMLSPIVLMINTVCPTLPPHNASKSHPTGPAPSKAIPPPHERPHLHPRPLSRNGLPASLQTSHSRSQSPALHDA